MSSSVTEAILEKKLMSVSNTQESIQTLSLWLLHHKAHHQKIVNTWLKVLKKDKVNHRLILFYLANDVIQNCKRKNVSFFKDAFAEVLKEATLFVRDEHIRKSVDRVFKIWGERNVYESDFIAELQGILTHAKVPATASSSSLSQELDNFKFEKVVEKIRAVKKLEMESSTKSSTVNLSKLNSSNAEIVQKLKDRKHGQNFSREFDENSRCLDELVKTMSKEINERTELIGLLELSEMYYKRQRDDVKLVANAYKNFATRLKTLQKKLEDMMPTFESPIPSPCPDAPSPTNSEIEAELNLPGEEKQNDSDLEKSASSSVSSSSKPTASSIGNPIPTVSNLFTQEPGSMTSWLDTFSKKTNSPAISPSTNTGNQKDNVSLDSRLSSLLQNIPNLPSGFQNTLFGAGLTENSESVTNSPASVRKGNNNLFQSSDAQTPVKDEYSGQNTPLQDEDTPSSGATFFSRLAATPKASQSPKEILKGLKDFIQNASSISNEKSHVHENSLSWPSDKSEPTAKVKSSETGKTVSRFSDASSNFPASVYESPQHPLPSMETSLAGNNTSTNVSTNFSQISFSDTLTYAPMQSSSETSISQSIHQNLSFIPTLVPSTPTGNTFSFCGDNSYNTYSSNIQNFEADMDIDSGDEDSRIVGNAEHSDLSDSKAGDSLPRQSALITLVTDNGTVDASSGGKKKAFDGFSKSDRRHFSEAKRRHFSDSKQRDFPESKRKYLPEAKRDFSDANRGCFPKIDKDCFPKIDKDCVPEPNKGYFPESSNAPFSEADKGYFSGADKDQFFDAGQVHFLEGNKNLFPKVDRAIFPETERGSFLEPSKNAFSEPDRRPASKLDGTSFPEPDRFITPVSSSYPEGQSDWPINLLQPESTLSSSALPRIKETTTSASCDEQDSLNEAYFPSTPPPPIESSFPNGQRGVEPPVNTATVPLSKIETVQSHRTATENNWDRPDWNNFEFDKQGQFGEQRPPMEYHDYHHKKQFNPPWPRFPPQNHWAPPPQYRPPPVLDYGPQPRRFPPFSPRGRGRGWNRHPRPQY